MIHGGDTMPNSAEIIERAVNDFTKVQKCMLLAKEENAMKTYAELKDNYIALKVLLTSLGVNLTAIDKIKE
jgi:hypothetical protein